MKVVEVDFGMGNIRSLQKAFEYWGKAVEVSSDPKVVEKADVLLLPGDGAFGKAIEELKKRNLFETIVDAFHQKKPILGICIGFQLLFESSYEFGEHKGFNFLSGVLSRFKGNLPVPHISWARTYPTKNSVLFNNIAEGSYLYYVHSYAVKEEVKETTAVSHYGEQFVASIECNNLFGVQFHPEKSSKVGLQIIKNFISFAKDTVV